MRKITQLHISEKHVFAVCEDGTLWRAKIWDEGKPVWLKIDTPPEGDGRDPPTIEEQAETLAEGGGRQLIIGRGKKQ